MLISDIITALEDFAPRAYQESYDNAGLCVGSAQAEARAALLCLDVTEAVVQEAVARGANLIISHHPVIFSGLKQLTGSTATERMVQQALRHDVALYAAHTNLDSVRGGVSERMCDRLELTHRSLLRPTPTPDVGLGMVGLLPAPLAPADFLQRVRQAFGAPHLRYAAPSALPAVSRVAVCGGSGSALLGCAVATGAHAFVTADLKYHDLQAAAEHLVAVDVGHYESEIAAVDIFYEVITKKFPTFAAYLSSAAVNPVSYL